MDHLEGELAGFLFQAEDGSFAVARVRSAEREYAAVGPLGHLQPGAHLMLEGRWSEHPRHGRRFQVVSYLVDDPRTLEGMRAWLESTVPGLGPEFVRRIVDRFGLETLQVLDETPERLKEVSGIGEKRLSAIVENWKKDQANRQLVILLRAQGLGAAVTRRILDRYGERALSVVSSDPYRLAAEVQGVAFRTADAIAKAMGIGQDDPRRADAAVLFLLDEAGDDGHCFLPLRELAQRAQRLGVASVEPSLNRLTLKGEVVQGQAADPEARPIWRKVVERRERRVAERLLTRVAEAGHADPGLVRRAEERVGLQLDPEQGAAVLLALTHGLTVITGGPGTGKTTIVRVLVEAANLAGERWGLAAPTGRAARRLAESTGREGKTIHRLLEWSPMADGFTRDAANPLDLDGVLIDECSMVDLQLMDALLDALSPKARLVLVGDADQLPSVGAGQVLRDLVEAGSVPVARLRQVYRQAAGSGIVRNAWRILRGEMPISSEKEGTEKQDFFLVGREDPLEARKTLLQVVAERLPARGFDPLTEVQVLTPMHKGDLGSQALNQALQDLLNPVGATWNRGQKRLRVGDRVIQTRNDYDTDVFNGDVGRVTGVGESGIEVDFDGRTIAFGNDKVDTIELAWAISIHKSQGSEYPAVVVALHRSHFVMLRRNLLYTAITRARRFCCVVGSPWALGQAVREPGGNERFTGLAQRLRQP